MDDETTQIIEGYRAWLLDNDYAPSTVHQGAIDARRVLAVCLDETDEELPARLWVEARRMRRFFDDVGADPSSLGPRFERLCTPAMARKGQRQRSSRKREAKSLDPEAWRQLYADVRAEPSFEARVLEMMMVTGLRVGDVFRIGKNACTRALGEAGTLKLVQKGRRERQLDVRSGPLRDSLERLRESWPQGPQTVQDVLGNTYHAAYHRVNRTLKRLAGPLPGRAHTHRLRRTVAMRALSHTKNPVEVAKLLGHRSVKTTLGYLDEETPERVAEIQSQLHEEFLK